MSKELPYFQFEPAQYLAGEIQVCTLQSQGLFINICSLYWQRDCTLSKVQIDKRYGRYKEELDELLALGIISYTREDNLVIDFLLEQYETITKDKKVRSVSGSIGNLKRWHPELHEKYINRELSLEQAISIATQSHSDGNPIATQSHKIREEKIIEEEIREYKEKNLNIPSFDDFKDYAIEKESNIDIQDLERKYNIWVELNWHDGNGKEIKNWKVKLLNTLPYLKKDDTKKTYRVKWRGKAWQEVSTEKFSLWKKMYDIDGNDFNFEKL